MAARPSMMAGHETDPAAQMAAVAQGAGSELLETWLILEFCDQGSFDAAIRGGRFKGDLVRALLICRWLLVDGPVKERMHAYTSLGPWRHDGVDNKLAGVPGGVSFSSTVGLQQRRTSTLC